MIDDIKMYSLSFGDINTFEDLINYLNNHIRKNTIKEIHFHPEFWVQVLKGHIWYEIRRMKNYEEGFRYIELGNEAIPIRITALMDGRFCVVCK